MGEGSRTGGGGAKLMRKGMDDSGVSDSSRKPRARSTAMLTVLR